MVEIPDEWREHIHPRRGGVTVPRAVLDEDAARRARDCLRAARPIAAEMAGHERTDPELGEATRAWLDGEPDPAGAAAVAAVALKYVEGTEGPAVLDAWALDHGLPFAACAITEASSLALGPEPTSSGSSAVHANKPGGGMLRASPVDVSGTSEWIADDAVVKRLRTLLAAAPETEYRDAVARLSTHRLDDQRRRTATYLVPTETAWTDELLDGWMGPGTLTEEHVLCSLSAVHTLKFSWTMLATPTVAGTLLDGQGAGALPVIEKAFGGVPTSAEEHEIALKALLAIPDERIVSIMLDHIGEQGVPAALREAGRRYPVLTVRGLGPLIEDGTTRGLQVAGLLRELLYASPDLAAELPPGSVEPLLPRPAVPDGDDVPGVLAGTPRRSAKVDWADPATLPQILLRGGGRALPADATRRLLHLLAARSPDVAAVLDACDRHSLAEFSWALFQRWYACGAPSRHNWAQAQLGLIGDDTTVRRLAVLIRVWPGEGGTSRATSALDALAAIGSDVALTHLFELARRGKYKGIKTRAARKIEEVAAAHGTTPDELADHAVPDFGLDERGTLTLDYGPRTFTVTFDEQLVPLVLEPNGKVRKSAPKPAAKDDPVLAPAAHALFTGLKKDVRMIADQEIRRLESAMVTRRSWTPADFHTLFVTHPLLGHITRRLVWITDGGTAFRVAEDRSCADVDDDGFAPEPGARVAIAHPLLLGDDLDTWTELFADSEILQPFDQLGRPVHRLTDGERAAHRLARAEGLVLPYGKAKGHSQGRWESVDADGEFSGAWLARRDPAGLYVVANLSPGLQHYMYGYGEDQKIRTVWAGAEPAHTPSDGAVPLGEVDPVTMSEALHDLTRAALPQ